ncbi:MAG TPA: ATP-binding protein [Actinotalea sp.]|nr:ATP-binding protein [Actinotalea sp.]
MTAGLLFVALAVGAVLLTAFLDRGRVAVLDQVVLGRVEVVTGLADQDRLPDALPVTQPGEIVQLLDADGRVLASSPTASRTLPVLPAESVAAWRGEAGDAPVVRTTATAYDAEARVALVAATSGGAPVTVVASVPLAEVRGVLRALGITLVAVVPVLTALLAAAIWVALGRALHPVDQLRRAAAQVARTGGPGALPVPPGDDELAALARTLNEMLDRLEVAAARQRSFVADAAHELRSPLAAARASLEVARAHPSAYTGAELAEDLEGEVLRMQALVDDLLLLARVGSSPTAVAEVDLLAVARDGVATSGGGVTPSGEGGADRWGADRVGTDPVRVEVVGAGCGLGDAVALSRVVRNLVDNARRHARSRVRVCVGDGEVVVDDDGSGIAPADRERVFERFVRLDEAREREAGGSGLGLAIAREIARDAGGDVVLDDSPWGGVRATLTVPRTPPTPESPGH